MKRKPFYYDYCNHMMWQYGKEWDDRNPVVELNSWSVKKCLDGLSPELREIIVELYGEQIDIPVAVQIVGSRRGISKDVLFTILSRFCYALAKERGLL